MIDRTESRVQFIYEPAREGLAQVESNLRQMTHSSEIPMGSLLEHALDTPGKRVRPAITILASQFHPHDSSLTVALATAVELLHIATLIHDDTVDDSPLRRGHATVSNLWGQKVAVLLGDFVFAASAAYVCNTNNVRVIRRFCETILELSNGELSEIFSAYDWRQTREEYFRRIYNKTASLLRTAAESGAILSGVPENGVQALCTFGRNVGMAFQVVDDILDFQGTEAEVGKPVGNDLRQGTITLPALLLLERYPDNNPLQRLQEEEGREESVCRAVEMVQNSTIIQDSYAIALQYCETATKAIQELPDNRARRSLLEMATYLMERRK